MKRLKTAPRKKREVPSPAVSDNEHDDTEAAWFARLCGELEHPDRSRRQGASAALRCLSQIVRLRAEAERSSRQAAWVHVFHDDPVRVDRAAPSAKRILQTIERAIIEREQARKIAREAGEAAAADLVLN